MREYERWRSLVNDEHLKNELCAMENAPEKIQDAFYRALEFGTGGLRGTLGVGTNRMNIYTVGRATLGLCDYIRENGGKSVAIGYDTRIGSLEFARRTAEIFASEGVKTYLYKEPLPTPMLSYAVRRLGCDGGVMITASHNPKEYNGYKVYGSDGCQITDDAASAILANIGKRDYFSFRETVGFDGFLENGKIQYIGEDVFESYLDEVSSTSPLYTDEVDRSVSIVYTNLHGTGRRPVLEILARSGFCNVTLVEKQATHDGEFPTCPYPNPELPEALTLGIAHAKEKGADVLLATDPDCDRVGVAVRDGEEYKILTGNEVGLLLLDFIASQKKKHGMLAENPLAVKTIVTSELAKKIAEKYNIAIVDVLTGFKYIGEQIGMLEEKGEEDRYIFGFEESCGYLGGSYVRDKDGVYAVLLVAELCAYLAKRGECLKSRLDAIYREHGYLKNSLYSYTFGGAEGFDKMQSIMRTLRCGIENFAGIRVLTVEDYLGGFQGLPSSNVLRYLLDGGNSLVVRPSGTEPKLKLYVSANAENEEDATKICLAIKADVEKYFE